MLNADNGIGDAKRQIVVGVDTPFSFRLQDFFVGLKPCDVSIHVERAATIGDIDTFGTIAFHHGGLFSQFLRLNHVGHHKKANRVHTQISGNTDMLFRYVGFRAVCGDPDRPDAKLVGMLQLLDRSDPGKEERGQFRRFH